MIIRLFGPVEIFAAGQAIAVGPPQRCAVLAALTVEAGRPVMVERLIDRVWPDQPPAQARRAVQAHIARLRGLLAQAAAGEPTFPRLERRGGSYVIEAAADQVDLLRFRHLVELCCNPSLADARRVPLLREALALWRSDPLAGLRSAWADRTRQRWQREYLEAVLTWAHAELRMDNPAPVVNRLTELVENYPLFEPLVALLVRALLATGRPADAAELFWCTCDRLEEQLCAQPGAELRAAYHAVQRGETDGHNIGEQRLGIGERV